MFTAARTFRGGLALASAGAMAIATAGIVNAATEIQPPNTDVAATSNHLQITAGGNTLTCYSVSGTGKTPTDVGDENINPGTGGIDIAIDSVSLSNCDLNGFVAADVTASGGWKINVNNDSGQPEGTLIMPDNGAKVTADTCEIDLMASEIGPMDYVKPSVTANNQPGVSFESNGVGTYCPPATSGTPAPATMTGTLTFSPGIDVL